MKLNFWITEKETERMIRMTFVFILSFVVKFSFEKPFSSPFDKIGNIHISCDLSE